MDQAESVLTMRIILRTESFLPVIDNVLRQTALSCCRVDDIKTGGALRFGNPGNVVNVHIGNGRRDNPAVFIVYRIM